MTVVGELLSGAESAVVGLGASPWLLLLVALCCCVDGFFPPVPSESIVIAAAALFVTGEFPGGYLWLLLAAAALGALCGDLVAHAIGARVRVERLRVLRGARGRAVLVWARDLLEHRGSTVILSGRFVPVGRVAVNMAAGAVGYSRARFFPFAAVASVLWAVYSAAMGVGAGHLLRDSPLLAVGVGVVAGVLVGLLIDAVIGRARAFLAWRRTGRAAPGRAPVGLARPTEPPV